MPRSMMSRYSIWLFSIIMIITGAACCAIHSQHPGRSQGSERCGSRQGQCPDS